MKIYETNNSLAVFSDRNDGDLNFYVLTKEQLKKNWEDLTQKFNTKLDFPLYVNQVHQDNIIKISLNTNRPTPFTKADALITDLPRTPIGVFTADCCPVLIKSNKAVSATHAGWKSTLLEISSKTVSAYNKFYGIKPTELTAYIGPCIGQCCFELGDEVYDMFISHNLEWEKFFIRKTKWLMDLRGLNRFQLLKAGIPQNQIIELNECTYCNPEKYFSYRKMKKRNGSMFSFIFLK